MKTKGQLAYEAFIVERSRQYECSLSVFVDWEHISPDDRLAWEAAAAGARSE